MIRADSLPFEPALAPAWARPGGSWRDVSEGEALFFAGAALAALSQIGQVLAARALYASSPDRP
jgi:hypothetical protein